MNSIQFNSSRSSALISLDNHMKTNNTSLLSIPVIRPAPFVIPKTVALQTPVFSAHSSSVSPVQEDDQLVNKLDKIRKKMTNYPTSLPVARPKYCTCTSTTQCCFNHLNGMYVFDSRNRSILVRHDGRAYPVCCCEWFDSITFLRIIWHPIFGPGFICSDLNILFSDKGSKSLFEMHGGILIRYELQSSPVWVFFIDSLGRYVNWCFTPASNQKNSLKPENAQRLLWLQSIQRKYNSFTTPVIPPLVPLIQPIALNANKRKLENISIETTNEQPNKVSRIENKEEEKQVEVIHIPEKQTETLQLPVIQLSHINYDIDYLTNEEREEAKRNEEQGDMEEESIQEELNLNIEYIQREVEEEKGNKEITVKRELDLNINDIQKETEEMDQIIQPIIDSIQNVNNDDESTVLNQSISSSVTLKIEDVHNIVIRTINENPIKNSNSVTYTEKELKDSKSKLFLKTFTTHEKAMLHLKCRILSLLSSIASVGEWISDIKKEEYNKSVEEFLNKQTSRKGKLSFNRLYRLITPFQKQNPKQPLHQHSIQWNLFNNKIE